ncbi:acyltransferase [Cohnella xylanilytica]|uniref:Acyltransferase n=1 Tax=Cohnella xylanilytica TaxID=557555 RepID=A0A841TYE2_9BACL|nr:acyltransferase [Cohnella xylanilytica]MBB6693245.1 acyltransferase [Cohnella xylanilytica]
MANDVKFITGTHRTDNYKAYSLPIIIKDKCWIACNVTILPGVIIEEGCIVGAGSIVNKNTEPFGIYAGNPARLIRYRDPESSVFNIDDELVR